MRYSARNALQIVNMRPVPMCYYLISE